MDVTPTMYALAAAAPSRSGFTIGSNAFDAAWLVRLQNARNKIQFNGVGGLRTYINVHRPTNWAEHEDARSRERTGGDTPDSNANRRSRGYGWYPP
jgi:hypothetical protein